jgi:sugar phosphate permease
MTIAAVAGVEPHEAGLASGLINTSQQVGGALGLAILASIANSRTDSLMEDAGGAVAALPNALTEGFQIAFIVGAGFALLGAILAATLISSRESREHAEAAQRGEAAPAAAVA